MKAVVCGASGGIGQPLSLLLKACPLVDKLALYDVVNTPGVTADLSHISSIAQIEGYLPADDGMKKALTGADIVVIPAGIPHQRRHRTGSHPRLRRELPGRLHPRHLQPGQLHRPHCRRGAEEGRQVQPEEAVRCHHS
ncbi:hypothetical protein BAUCODRAFT_449032 [Baudoinia panamericana UAMH 10762]|uniref:malate dehydrogenase n=1 Tax=Baudoinia panamericana (strain UAMH 10762) TaxID=717646 RepID=M2MKZ9_BAUPA|nr:uncharacterized protein BAUCODRAFT_449032 [Baudoinia panamericana UAMH 10762]EMC97366.1 hypothetical protein BAUCODRAFT_449032 [Baudoinia panamericana UAMH 10762]